MTTTIGEGRLSRFTLRLVTLALVSAVVVIGGTSTALASLATATQNSDITVVASLESSAADTSLATVGDTVTATGSVTNNSLRKQVVKVTTTLAGPSGTLYSHSSSIPLSASETYSASDSLLLAEGTPTGEYTLTITASNKNGSSSASTSITVY
jgi:hypothetical protein